MKITVNQLRKIIREEVENLVVNEARKSTPKLGGIYKNNKREQISIEFLDNGFVGWELLSRGKSKSMDGTVDELNKFISDNGFFLDRIENVY